VDPVPDPLLLRKSGSTRNRTRDLWFCKSHDLISSGVHSLQLRAELGLLAPSAVYGFRHTSCGVNWSSKQSAIALCFSKG
jgi:hypothetical protein